MDNGYLFTLKKEGLSSALSPSLARHGSSSKNHQPHNQNTPDSRINAGSI